MKAKRVAISIRLPWAWLIVRPDIIGDEARRAAAAAGLIKDIENRSRDIEFQGEVFIHVSRTPADKYDSLRITIQNETGIVVPRFEDLPRGGIMGRAMFESPVTKHTSRWFTGPVGYPIFSSEPVRFAECLGTVTPLFFDVPETVKLPIF